jgi:hypothetical protein
VNDVGVAPVETPLGAPLADRVEVLERRQIHESEIAKALSTHAAVIDQIGAEVSRLSQQRGLEEAKMERQSRYSALDLAIKAAGEKPDLGVVTAYADAFLVWMKVRV